MIVRVEFSIVKHENFLSSIVNQGLKYCQPNYMLGMQDIRIACRIPREDDETIERLVSEGQFINKSDFFRQAVKKLLREVKG